MTDERCVVCGAIIPEGRLVCANCENRGEKNKSIKMSVSLVTFNDVDNFVKFASKCTGDVLVRSQKYIVNGKSIMGLYSLDLSKPIDVEIYGGIPLSAINDMAGIGVASMWMEG